MKHLLYGGMLIAIGMSVAAGQGSAATIAYYATLTGASEVPGVLTPATGNATLNLNGDLLTVTMAFSGLTGGPALAAHIHCCVAPGGNAPVIVPFTGFPAATSGFYTNTFNLNTLLGAAGEATLITGLNAGMGYVNIHNSVNPGGEIRGLLTTPTPEPATMLLSAGALAGLALRRRRSSKVS